MAATKYQVMYRYMNHIMNVPITNDQNAAYEPTFEFYTDDDHRIFSTDPNIQNEELEKQQEMISWANQAKNPKNDMLFIYNGCKKVPHKKWVPEQIGYIVRNWQVIRSKIGNRGDYSKEFTCLNAATPEDGATVVCTQAVFGKYFKNWSLPGGEYTDSVIQEIMESSTFFALTDPAWRDHAVPSNQASTYAYWSTTVTGTVLTGPIYVDVVDSDWQTINGYGYNTWRGASYRGIKTSLPDKAFSSVYYNASQVATTTIPGHYEDSPDAPYAIMDQYRRIESSPWLINCTVGSLDAALEKAKKLIEMIGIENVKVIKLVAIDQFLKIK